MLHLYLFLLFPKFWFLKLKLCQDHVLILLLVIVHSRIILCSLFVIVVFLTLDILQDLLVLLFFLLKY